MLHIGRARHSGPRRPPTGLIVVECVNVGGWPSNEDHALESHASSLSLVEHRLILAKARLVAYGHRTKSVVSSVWAPAYQETISGGQAGVGVVSLEGAPITLPYFCTPVFGEFLRLGRAIRVILPLASGSIAHLFVFLRVPRSCRGPT